MNSIEERLIHDINELLGLALTAEDVVWRRSKLGLRLTPEEISALDQWMAKARRGRAIHAAE